MCELNSIENKCVDWKLKSLERHIEWIVTYVLNIPGCSYQPSLDFINQVRIIWSKLNNTRISSRRCVTKRERDRLGRVCGTPHSSWGYFSGIESFNNIHVQWYLYGENYNCAVFKFWIRFGFGFGKTRNFRFNFRYFPRRKSGGVNSEGGRKGMG